MKYYFYLKQVTIFLSTLLEAYYGFNCWFLATHWWGFHWLPRAPSSTLPDALPERGPHSQLLPTSSLHDWQPQLNRHRDDLCSYLHCWKSWPTLRLLYRGLPRVRQSEGPERQCYSLRILTEGGSWKSKKHTDLSGVFGLFCHSETGSPYMYPHQLETTSQPRLTSDLSRSSCLSLPCRLCPQLLFLKITLSENSLTKCWKQTKYCNYSYSCLSLFCSLKIPPHGYILHTFLRKANKGLFNRKPDSEYLLLEAVHGPGDIKQSC